MLLSSAGPLDLTWLLILTPLREVLFGLLMVCFPDTGTPRSFRTVEEGHFDDFFTRQCVTTLGR